jgi:DNA-binding FrmR family transcriptional regulator
MAITPANKEKLKSRLAKAIGHLNAVHRMVDEQKYCIDVLNQLKAVQAALDKTAEVILRQHLETCVVEAVKNQDSPRVIEELMQVFRQAPSLYAQDDDIQDVIPVSISNTPANGMKPGCCQ